MLRAERLVRNQALCREANEAVLRAAGALSSPAEEAEPQFDFLCECARRVCAELISLTVREYDEIRGDPAAFVVAPGHEIESIEKLVRSGPRFRVVRKFHPEPLKLARELDPRRDRDS